MFWVQVMFPIDACPPEAVHVFIFYSVHCVYNIVTDL